MEANTPTAEPLQGSHTEQEAPEPHRAPEPGCLLCSAGAAALGAALASRRVPSAGLLKMELLHPFPEAGNPGVHPRAAFPSNEAQFHSMVATAGTKSCSPLAPKLPGVAVLNSGMRWNVHQSLCPGFLHVGGAPCLSHKGGNTTPSSSRK